MNFPKIAQTNTKVASHNFCRSSVEILHRRSDISSHPSQTLGRHWFIMSCVAPHQCCTVVTGPLCAVRFIDHHHPQQFSLGTTFHCQGFAQLIARGLFLLFWLRVSPERRKACVLPSSKKKCPLPPRITHKTRKKDNKSQTSRKSNPIYSFQSVPWIKWI